jgi:pSer/pThr/pTyr-binding forkhead associated (FHA) protein
MVNLVLEESIVPRQLSFYILSTRQQVDLELKRKTVLGRVSDEEHDVKNIDLSPFLAYQLGVSRRHLMLVPEDEEILAFDLSSRNGSFINGDQLSPRKGFPLKDGDELRLGSLEIRVYIDRDVPYKDMQTRPLVDVKDVERLMPKKQGGMTVPMPDIRETLATNTIDTEEKNSNGN